MNCRKSIFKFLGIAAVCAASAACSVDDADDLALVKLGALKKEFVVEADANTFDIDIYANSAFHIERINQADWISLTCGETEDGKGAITAECEFNEGFKRKAGFVLCSDVDARRDTVYVKQKALVDAKIEFANSSVIVAGAGGENISPIETNIPFSEITVDIEYAKADNADWIESAVCPSRPRRTPQMKSRVRLPCRSPSPTAGRRPSPSNSTSCSARRRRPSDVRSHSRSSAKRMP